MAYAFNRIDRLMDKKKKTEDESLSRSFSPSPSASAAVSSAPSRATATTPESAGAFLKESRPADNMPRRRSFNKQAAGRASFEASKGKLNKIPGFLGSIRGDISSRRAEIKSQADKFAESQRGETAKAYGYTPEEIESALSGGASGPEAFTKLQALLNKKLGRNISSPKLSDPNIPRARYLTSNTGLKDLYSKKRSPSYTPGMAEFDLGSLRANPNFTTQVGGLIRDQDKLRKEAGELYKTRLDEAKAHDLSTLESNKKAIQDYLAEKKGTLTQDQVDEAEALSKELESIYNRTHAGYEPEILDSLKSIERYLNRIGVKGDEKKALMNLYVDKYKKSAHVRNTIGDSLVLPRERGSKYLPINMYSKEEADRFNRINELLGEGDTRAAGLVDKDLKRLLKRGGSVDKNIANTITVDRLKHWDGVGKDRKKRITWTTDTRNNRHLKNGLLQRDVRNAFFNGINRMYPGDDQTGKGIGTRLFDEFTRRYRNHNGRSNWGKWIQNAVKVSPTFRKYYDRDGGMPNLKDLTTPDAEKMIGEIINNGGGADKKSNYLSMMLSKEGQRNPFYTTETPTISKYNKFLGAPEFGKEDFYGSHTFLENPSDPKSNAKSKKTLEDYLSKHIFGSYGAAY